MTNAISQDDLLVSCALYQKGFERDFTKLGFVHCIFLYDYE